MSRIYVSEHKRFLDEVGYEIARWNGRLQNAFNWYCGNPTDTHLAAINEAWDKLNDQYDKLRKHHANLNPQLSYIVDPEPGDDA